MSSVSAPDIQLIVAPPARRRVPVRFRKTAKRGNTAFGPLVISKRSRSLLSQEAFDYLVHIQHAISFSTESTVFVEGQQCRGVFILCEGRAKLSIANSEGRTLIVRIVGPGEILALNACLTGGLHDMTLETLQPSEFAFIRREDFLEFLNIHKEAYCLAGEQLIRDYRGTYELVRSVGLSQTTAEKLARFLLHSASDSAQNGVYHLATRLTHDEIGQRIGATRETVTRILSRLRKKRVIEPSKSGLLIRNMSALERMIH